MTSFLVAYGTSEGQTAKVATRIGEAITARGHEATVVNADEIPADLAIDDFDAVLVGGSIHRGRQQPVIRALVDSNRDALRSKPTAFFQVSLSSTSEEGRTQAAEYVETFLEETEWHPDRIGLFGGALRYSEYGFLTRLLMKQIARRNIAEMPEADASGDIEFTDWIEVDAFANDVAAFVEGHLGVVPPESSDEGG